MLRQRGRRDWLHGDALCLSSVFSRTDSALPRLPLSNGLFPSRGAAFLPAAPVSDSPASVRARWAWLKDHLGSPVAFTPSASRAMFFRGKPSKTTGVLLQILSHKEIGRCGLSRVHLWTHTF